MVPVPRFLSPRLHDKRCEAKRRKTANDVESKPESKTTSGRTSPEGDGVPVMGDGDVTMDMGPIMPSFLNLTREEMDAKFDDLNWDERIRLTKGQPSNPNFDWKWSMFKQTDTQERGMMDRYVNIKPWNHNRVKLNVPASSLNYVNASLISLDSPSDTSRPPLRYIAMQGPTDPSLGFVWRMIAEATEDPAVIVQLTSNFEGGTVKCSQYFPDDTEEEKEWLLNDSDAWGDGWQATLKFESKELLCADAIERRKLSLHVHGEDKARTVWHFWYRGWPDFGVPAEEDLETFLELMRLSREHSSPKGPRVIHCSAGVGRTGTFIALEHLLRELDVGALCDPPSPPPTSNGKGKTESKPEAKPDVVYDVVQELRKQRKGMVQTEQQYRFLYNTLQRLWRERYEPSEDDDDKTDGGAQLHSLRPTPSPCQTPNEGSDPFAVPDNDDDEGGVKLQVPTKRNI